MSIRNWLQLGKTSLDTSHIVKIVFDSAATRLFVVAGEALLMTAWTKEKPEVSALKKMAATGAGWVNVRTEESDPETLDQRVKLDAVDMMILTDTKSGPVGELFVKGVFVGQVVGQERINSTRQLLDIAVSA